MPMLPERVTVVYGHYGTGKTNLSLNLAIDCAESGEEVTLIDMDVVNPYFRSSDHSKELESMGIRVIGPNFANSNLDTPSLPASIRDAILEDPRVIIDVGGDDAGATALGVYRRQLESVDPEVIYVINRYRSQTTSPEEAATLLREIESASGIRATGIVNNSHLKQLTGSGTIEGSIPFAEDVSRLTGLPIRFHTAPLGVEILNKKQDYYRVRVLVNAPWEEAGNRMPRIIVDNNRCKGCEMCVIACPKEILELDHSITNSKGYHPAHVLDESKCIGCGSCTIMCPDCAIIVEVD